MREKRQNPASGFTMIEFLIALAIILLLFGILINGYLSAMQKSRDGRRKADLGVIQTALESYKIDYGTYPPNPNPGMGVPHPYEVPSSISYTDISSGQVTTYLSNTPQDPLYDRGNYYYCYVPANPIDNLILSYTLSAVFETESSLCPGQPTATPTPTYTQVTLTPSPTPTNTPTPTPTPALACINPAGSNVWTLYNATDYGCEVPPGPYVLLGASCISCTLIPWTCYNSDPSCLDSSFRKYYPCYCL